MKKGNKVYVLIEAYTYDFENDIRTSVFLSEDDAYKALEEIKERELEESWISRFNDEDLEIGEDSYDSFDIYLEGRASEFETHLWVAEKEVR